MTSICVVALLALLRHQLSPAILLIMSRCLTWLSGRLTGECIRDMIVAVCPDSWSMMPILLIPTGISRIILFRFW
jgi:hypothetical protein